MLALGQDNICTVVLACFASGIANFAFIVLNSIAPDLNFTFTNIFLSHHRFFLDWFRRKGVQMDIDVCHFVNKTYNNVFLFREKCFSEYKISKPVKA